MISNWRGGFILGDYQLAVDKINYISKITEIEPRWVKVHNSVKHIKQLRTGCPNTHLVLRLTAPEGVFNGYINDLLSNKPVDPVWAARNYFSVLRSMIDSDTPLANLWLESCPPGFQAWSLSGWLNDYYIEFMKVAEANGLHAMICNFYTGTPHTKSDGIDGWSPFMPAVSYAANHGHIIGAHAYFEMPDRAMLDEGHWTAYRPLRVMQDYGFPSNTVWVPGEFSWDGPGGYRDYNISGNDMRAAWNRASETYQGTCVDGLLGYIIQGWGTEWDGFVYLEIFDQLLQDMVDAGADTGIPIPPLVDPPVPPTPPVPPVSGDNLVINGSFEEGSRKVSADLDLPNDWGFLAGEGLGTFHAEIEHHPTHVLEGLASGRLWQSYSTRPLYFYQEIDVEPGAEYKLTASAFGWSNNSNPQPDVPSEANIIAKVGIDPFGTTDPDATYVVWSGQASQEIRDRFSELTVTARAKEDKLTIFLYAKPEYGMQRNDIFWDKVSLVKISDPIPPVTKTTTTNLYLRTGPGQTNPKITIMPAGTQVTVKSSANGWASVEVSLSAWAVTKETNPEDYKTWRMVRVTLTGYCSESYLA